MPSSSNSTENSATGLLNPFTPLAWLPPEIASQVEVCQFLLAGVCGAWIWDCLISSSEEYIMIKKYKVRLPDIVYILCRITTFALLVTTLIFITGPLPNINCQKLVRALSWCGAIAMPLNSLLFFFRVRAIFHDSSRITFAFRLLWLTTLVGISATFASEATHIGNTNVCLDTRVDDLTSIGIIVLAIYDTIVYLAIGFRLRMINLVLSQADRINIPTSTRNTLRMFFSGTGMGEISKALLKSGQLFYLATVGVNIAVLVITFDPSSSPVYRGMFAVINAALQNAMACRVFRQVKIGLLHENPSLSLNSASATTPKFKLTPKPWSRFRTHHSTSQSISPADDIERRPVAGIEHLVKRDIISLCSLGDIEAGNHSLSNTVKPVPISYQQ